MSVGSNQRQIYSGSMASPVGHALAGYIGYKLIPGSKGKAQSKWWLLGAIVLSNAPDIDFLPGLLMGDFRAFHRHGTHSLTSALVAGSMVALGVRWSHYLRRRRFRKKEPVSYPPCVQWGIWATLIYSGHLGLDLLMVDQTPPFGLPLLWPLSQAFLASSITLIPGLTFDPVLSLQNLRVFGTEILLSIPFLWMVEGICPRSNQKS